MQMTQRPRKAGFRSENHGSTRTYRLWTVVCVLASVWTEAKNSTAYSLKSTFHVQPLKLECCISALSPKN
eukprot:4074077-Amphidinium_carterae.1